MSVFDWLTAIGFLWTFGVIVALIVSGIGWHFSHRRIYADQDPDGDDEYMRRNVCRMERRARMEEEQGR